jgi:hypothetical protein
MSVILLVSELIILFLFKVIGAAAFSYAERSCEKRFYFCHFFG